jgi:hypothetical protein
MEGGGVHEVHREKKKNIETMPKLFLLVEQNLILTISISDSSPAGRFFSLSKVFSKLDELALFN